MYYFDYSKIDKDDKPEISKEEKDKLIELKKLKASERSRLYAKNLTLNQIIHRKVSSYIRVDTKKGFVTDLTDEWFLKNIYGHKCIYCGNENNIGCDRIDNNSGHSIDNIVPCCRQCNSIRNNYFTYDEMKKISKFLVKEIYSRRCV